MPPKKPRPDFPLFVHRTGRWCKKVRGKHWYFGKVADDPDGKRALAEWLRVRDDLLAGRPPRPKVEGITLREVCNRFLAEKERAVTRGELRRQNWKTYYRCCYRLGMLLGWDTPVVSLQPEDFAKVRDALARGRKPSGWATDIRAIRTVFRFAYESGLIPAPVRFGPSLKAPPLRLVRLAKAANGGRMFEAEEVRKLLAIANPTLRAAILLGLNGALGPADIARLPAEAVDLDKGWLTYPRPKTGIPRRAWLWPETRDAIRQAIAGRPRPLSGRPGERLLLGPRGGALLNADGTGHLRKLFSRALTATGTARAYRGLYGLRHTFRTVADETLDKPAIDMVMGHAPADIGSRHYLERIADERIQRVCEHVRRWLFEVE